MVGGPGSKLPTRISWKPLQSNHCVQWTWTKVKSRWSREPQQVVDLSQQPEAAALRKSVDSGDADGKTGGRRDQLTWRSGAKDSMLISLKLHRQLLSLLLYELLKKRTFSLPPSLYVSVSVSLSLALPLARTLSRSHSLRLLLFVCLCRVSVTR